MTRNFKALGLALLAICALGAVAAQGASAVNHQFKSDGPTAITGHNIEGNDKFQVGAAGTVECTVTDLEATAPDGDEDTLTVTPRYTGCTFGGQPATVNFNHCAYKFFSDTTATEGKEHANVEIECSEGTKIEVHTAVCTITIDPQLVPHAVSYEKDGAEADKTKIKSTAKNITVTKTRNTGTQPANGCLTFPSGAIGTYTGTATTECFKDEGSEQTGTTKTTPPTLNEGLTTECSVK